MVKKFEVKILNDGQVLTAKRNENLLDLLHKAGYRVPSPCGGMGLCGKCKVKLVQGGSLSSPTGESLLSEEELQNRIRLSCRLEVKRDLILEIPSYLLKENGEYAEVQGGINVGKIEPNPVIERLTLELPEPCRSDQRSDATRVLDELGEELSIPHRILSGLPGLLREDQFRITITSDKPAARLISLEAGHKTGGLYGMVFDIGTTTIASYTVDLKTGKTMAADALKNPQRDYGVDVVSRIKHVKEQEDGLKVLQRNVIKAVNELIERFLESQGADYNDIYCANFVGNTVMLHFLAGVDPANLDQAPYIPAFTDLQKLHAHELGVRINPEGVIFLLPCLSGYVGSDIVSGILQTGMHKSSELNLLLDIGTNGEIVLGNRDRMLAASTAAGPAFEGASIEQGMMAGVGAISHLYVTEEGKVKVQVVGDEEPKGLCGSGIVDAVGELLKVGVIREQGDLFSEPSRLPSPLRESFAQRLTGWNDEKAIKIVCGESPVVVTQADVREVQLAKGAIRAGVEVLLEEFSVSARQIDNVYLAGAFGNYLNKDNVLRIGILPRVDSKKIIPVGNAAGFGAKLALVDRQKLREMEKIAQMLEYIELSFRSDFSQKFVSSMKFPA